MKFLTPVLALLLCLPVRAHPHKRVLFWHVANNDAVVSHALEELKAAASLYSAEVKYSAHPPTSPAMLTVLRGQNWLTEIPLDRQRFPDDATRSYYEFPTLSAVHEHCTESPTDFVAYVHTKTDATKRRDYMSKIFPRFEGSVLGNTCIGELERGKAACGVNLHGAKANGDERHHGASWCHFSGNFFWARCDYVSKLNHPWHTEASAELWWEHPSGFGGLDSGRGYRNHRDTRAFGRYFAEWWLLNDVNIDVLINETSPKRAQMSHLRRWLAGYEPDSAGVWRRAHIVNDTRTKGLRRHLHGKCSADPERAFKTTGTWCVTQAARRLADHYSLQHPNRGNDYIWRWPTTCPGALLFDSIGDGFTSANSLAK